MLIVLFSVCILVNLITALLGKKNAVIGILSCILIVLIIGGNNQNADYTAYKYFYTTGLFPKSAEFGFVKLMEFGKWLHLDYNIFVLFIAIISVSCIAFFSVRYSENYHFVIIFYMAYMMFMDTIQIRNFLMIALFHLAFEALLHNKKILYLLILAVAFMVHYSTLPLFVFVFINPNHAKKSLYAKLVLGSVIVLSLITFLNGNKVPFIEDIADVILSGREDKEVYFLTATNLGFLTTFFCYFFNLFLFYISKRFINENAALVSEADVRFADVAFQIALVSSFALPLAMMNSNFSRYVRVNNIALYVLIAKVMSVYSRRGTAGSIVKPITLLGRGVSKYIYFVIALINVIAWIFLKGVPESMLEILQHNVFFQW